MLLPGRVRLWRSNQKIDPIANPFCNESIHNTSNLYRTIDELFPMLRPTNQTPPMLSLDAIKLVLNLIIYVPTEVGDISWLVGQRVPKKL